MPKRRLRSAPKWNADADGMRWLYLSTSAREYFSYQREKVTVINIINIEDARAL